MAYPLKEYTAAEYLSLPTETFEDVVSDKIYYMPAITDGAASWTLNIYNIDDPQGSPVITLNDTLIQSGYRILMTTELSGTMTGGQQSHLVVDSGYGQQNRPWINAGISLASLPIGTVVSWTYFTQSYSAATDGNYTQNFEFIGTYLDFGQDPIVFPSNNTYVYTTGEDVLIYKIRLYVIDTDNNVLLNQEFDPTAYDVNGFIIKNEATIMQ